MSDEDRKNMYARAFETMVDKTLASKYAEELFEAVRHGMYSK